MQVCQQCKLYHTHIYISQMATNFKRYCNYHQIKRPHSVDVYKNVYKNLKYTIFQIY